MIITVKRIAHSLVQAIDAFVNKITMYRLLLWGLRFFFAISWLFSIVGIFPYGAVRPLVSISILIGVCLGVNYVFARLYRVASNNESSNITALLLYFILQPPRDWRDALALALAGCVAIASKYILTRQHRHIFNPAAFGALFVGLTGVLYSRWWVASSYLALLMGIYVLLVVHKIHRFPMVLSFAAAAVTLAVIRTDANLFDSLKLSLTSFPVLFFGGLMLTEPITTPSRRYQQIIYGLLVGLLFSSGLRVGGIGMTPELALILGNLLVFALHPRSNQPLVLLGTEEIGRTIWEYRFKPLVPLHFLPGQYVELTAPLQKPDALGNRRTFTIASSPTEDDIRFGVKHAEHGSAFKNYLKDLPVNSRITANNLAGDFLLPFDEKTKLVYIAGGIGITPFRSHLKYLIDNRQSRNITLFYAVSDPKQIVYKDILEQAKEYGLKVVYVLTPAPGQETPKSWKHEVGFITPEMIRKHVLDFDKRVYYISGPNAMVISNKALLRSMGIPRSNIKTDYFSGY